MDGLNGQILHGFSLKSQKITKEKSYYICNTDKGLKTVCKTELPPEAILFSHAVKEGLYGDGFINTDRFVLAAETGLPYLIYENETYIATDYFKLPESRFSDNNEFLRIISAVSKMHNIVKNAVWTRNLPDRTLRDPEDFYFDETPDIAYNKSISYMKSYKKAALKSKPFSDFDVQFIKNADYILESLQIWHKYAVSDTYSRNLTEAAQNKLISHNYLREETVLINNSDNINGEYITDFTNCSTRTYLYDLASVIKRYDKNLPEDPLPLSLILSEYDKNCRLSDSDLTVLFALLIYPDKFMNICGKYYSQKRTWIPATFGVRIEKLAAGREKYREFLKEAFANYF